MMEGEVEGCEMRGFEVTANNNFYYENCIINNYMYQENFISIKKKKNLPLCSGPKLI